MNTSLPGRQAKRGHPREREWHMQRCGSMSAHDALGTVVGVPGSSPRRAPLSQGGRLEARVLRGAVPEMPSRWRARAARQVFLCLLL